MFAPTVQLSITFEQPAGIEELHVHAAGQGFWVARMLSALGAVPVLCAPIGGETGTALRALLGDLPTDGLVPCSSANGAYVHDRREGERSEVAAFASVPLGRHAEDDLVSATIACALGEPVVAICGTNLEANVDPSVFQNVCHNLNQGGSTIVADLSGDELRAALAGGVGLLKISHEELVADGWAKGDSLDELLDGISAIRADGAADVLVSRAGEGSLVALGDRWYTVRSPEMSVVDHRGAGDSMTAALAFGRWHKLDDIELLRLAAAAAALNVTRHGLASGHLPAIGRLTEMIEVEQLDV